MTYKHEYTILFTLGTCIMKQKAKQQRKQNYIGRCKADKIHNIKNIQTNDIAHLHAYILFSQLYVQMSVFHQSMTQQNVYNNKIYNLQNQYNKAHHQMIQTDKHNIVTKQATHVPFQSKKRKKKEKTSIKYKSDDERIQYKQAKTKT